MMNNEKTYKLSARLREYALRIIKLYSALPKSDAVADIIGRQLLRSGTSIGAQYAEAERSRSKAEFISKTESALQEASETLYWLDLLVGSGRIPPQKMNPLINETNELIAILVSSVKTVKRGKTP